MATLVCFHAHPDDEAIGTGGTIARAKHEGHRVVLVVATRGELGETHDLAPGEDLAERRSAEVRRSAEILGIDRVEFLPYRDSGMAGDPRNDDEGTLHAAPVEDAARLLAAILREEDAAVLTVYDDHGTYGHPDHIKVHHVGHRAAVLAGTPRVLESAVNRDYLVALREMAPEQAGQADVDLDPETMDLGVAEGRITTWIDVRAFTAAKRAAIAAHRSQVGETSFFLQMPPEIFDLAFGWEWFIAADEAPGGRSERIFP